MSGRGARGVRARADEGAVLDWTPLAYGPVLWLRAGLGVAYTDVGGGVLRASAWGDQSGQGNHCAQGTGGQQPRLVQSSAAYGGRAVITYQGSQWLDCTNAAFLLAQPFTLVVVGNTGAPVPYETHLDTIVSTAGRRAIARNAGTGGGASLWAGTEIASTAALHNPCILYAEFNGASSTIRVSSNTVALTGNPGTNALEAYRLGAAPAGVYPLIAGSAQAEVVLLPSILSSSARQAFLSDCAAYYRLSLS